MNYKALFQKLYVVVALLLAVVVHLAEPVDVEASTGDASGTTDGSLTSFGFNNPTFVSGIQIMDASGTTAIGSGFDARELTRLSEFVIQFDVYDLDGFKNLDLYIALFNLDSPSATTDSGVLETVMNSGLSDTSLVLRWLAPERASTLSGMNPSNLVITSGHDNFYVKSGVSPISSGVINDSANFIDPSTLNESITWEAGSGVQFGTASSQVLQSGVFNVFDGSGTTIESSGVRNIQYRVRIPIRMSKVAPTSGVWNLGVMVHDRLQQEIENESKTNTTVITHRFADDYYQNQWYGEVNIVDQNPQIIFSGVQAGSTGFKTSEASGLEGVEVLFISNGQFNQQVQADSTWNPLIEEFGRPQFAYLVASSGLDDTNDVLLRTQGNRFALQARRTQFAGGDSENLTWTDILPLDGGLDPTVLIPPADNSGIYRANRNPGSSAVTSVIGTISTVNVRTDETGVTSRFEFGLRISSVFSNTTYSGNISIGISNKPEVFQTTEPNPS